MNILHFSPYPVNTPRHGGQLRVAAIQNALNQSGMTSTILPFYCAQSYTESGEDPLAVRANLREYLKPTSSVDVAFTLYASHPFIEDKDCYASIRESVTRLQPDILCLEQTWLWPLVKKLRQDDPALARLPLVYSSQNFEARLYAPVLRLKGQLSEDVIQAYLEQVRALELDLLRSADLIIAVTEQDANDFRQHTTRPVVVFRNGINLPPEPVNLKAWRQRYAGYKTAFYISSAHAPNAVGVIHLLTPAGFLPPTCRIVIGGQVSLLVREMEEYLRYQGINDCRFDFLNALSPEDLSAMLSVADVMVLPITEGSGSNLKTAEALYTRKPILATSIAMRGYEEFLKSPQVCVEDDPKNFREQLFRLFTQAPPTLESAVERDFPVDAVLWKNRLIGLPEAFASIVSRNKDQ